MAPKCLAWCIAQKKLSINVGDKIRHKLRPRNLQSRKHKINMCLKTSPCHIGVVTGIKFGAEHCGKVKHYKNLSGWGIGAMASSEKMQTMYFFSRRILAVQAHRQGRVGTRENARTGSRSVHPQLCNLERAEPLSFPGKWWECLRALPESQHWRWDQIRSSGERAL